MTEKTRQQEIIMDIVKNLEPQDIFHGFGDRLLHSPARVGRVDVHCQGMVVTNNNKTESAQAVLIILIATDDILVER